MYNTDQAYPAAILFDLDGVLIDTETQYDVFWKKMGEDYQLGIEDFEQVIKGTSLPNIISRYFSHLPEQEQLKVIDLNHDFEFQMSYDYIPGALEFLLSVKKEGIKTGLVTSSDDIKLQKVFEVLHIEQHFESIVSGDRITEGKPHPACYLLAAQDLGVDPSQCIVFEDSFQGIEAGNAAGMRVVGLSTTNPEETIKDKVWKVIPHFESLTLNEISKKD